MSAEDQKYTLSYSLTQSRNFYNTANSRVKAAHLLNTCSYAKTSKQNCLSVFKLNPQESFSIVSVAIIEEVVASKSIELKILKITYRNKFRQFCSEKFYFIFYTKNNKILDWRWNILLLSFPEKRVSRNGFHKGSFLCWNLKYEVNYHKKAKVIISKILCNEMNVLINCKTNIDK